MTVAGGYIIHLRQDVAVVRERVVVLETRVVPVLNESKQETENAIRIQDLDGRVHRLEDNFDVDYNEKVKAARAKGLPEPAVRTRHR